MNNQFGFLSDDTFAEKMDTMNQFLAAIATGQGGSLKPTSWSDVQALVRKGLASKVFAVGDQLTCQRGSTTLVWDKAHHRFVKQEDIDKIFAGMPDKESLIGKLAEMYNEPIMSLMDEPDEKTGNVEWVTSW